MLSLGIWLATLLGTFSVGIPLYIMFFSPGVSAQAFLTIYYAVLRVKRVCLYFHLRDLVILKYLGNNINTLCCFREKSSVNIIQQDNERYAECVCQHSITEICSIA